MNVFLKEDSSGFWTLSDKVQATIEIDEQLDTSLDSGTIKYLSEEADTKGLNAALAGYQIITDFFKKDDGSVDRLTFDFVGMDSRALIGRPYVRKTVSGFAQISSIRIGTVYRHHAEGTIAITDANVIILKVSSDISEANPINVQYDKGKITWEVTWASKSRYSLPLGVQIEYEGVSTNSGIYSHQVSLTEPSKLLQGVMIDGFAVTQPEEYDKRDTLYAVVNRLLAVTPFDGVNDATQMFSLTNNTAVVNALAGIKSPQFKWNTQTTLWECLLQVGAVIDAIPRLVADTYGNYTVVTFYFVNAYSNYADSIDDSATNIVGESVDESLYSTALSAVVENLRENE